MMSLKGAHGSLYSQNFTMNFSMFPLEGSSNMATASGYTNLSSGCGSCLDSDIVTSDDHKSEEPALITSSKYSSMAWIAFDFSLTPWQQYMTAMPVFYICSSSENMHLASFGTIPENCGFFLARSRIGNGQTVTN